MRPHRPPTERGFTLIEVLIALAVIGIGLLAVLAVAAQSGKVASDVQDRTFADWVAENHIAELRLSPQWPDIGDSDGDETLAGRKWHWNTTVEATADKDLRRATVSVALSDTPDAPIARLVAFIGKPGSRPQGPPTAGSVASPAPAPSSSGQGAPKGGST